MITSANQGLLRDVLQKKLLEDAIRPHLSHLPELTSPIITSRLLP